VTEVREQKSEVSRRTALCARLYALCFVGALLFALSFPVEAQQSGKVHRIGYVSAGAASATTARAEALRQGLRELGYIEGQNIIIEWRFGEGKVDQVPYNVAELVRLKVDVIVTAGAADTRAAHKATSTIPIVMTQDNDPVGAGFVSSLARPGGNITGLTNASPELSGKRLELLKESIPKLSRAIVLGNATVPGNAQALRETEGAARTLGLKVRHMEVQSLDDLKGALRVAVEEQFHALVTLQNPVFGTNRTEFVDLVAKTRLPAMHFRRDFVEAGGLMSYGTYLPDLDRRAATYVDKILKGAKPADLPVEQPTKFELFINLKTAKQIGLTIPAHVLARADRVIK
jgi:putative ABC transport system substrate-binding protein